MSSAGHWDPYYAAYQAHFLERGEYGPSLTYQLAAKWLDPCDLVEDWGCGLGGFGNYRETPIVGIDGSPGPYTDIVADLNEYTSTVPGILVKSVLEHNYSWAQILDNACASFTERMCLVLFTPLLTHTHIPEQLDWVEGYEVPDLALPRVGLTSIMDKHGIDHTYEQVESTAGYGCETVFYMSKGESDHE